MIDPSKPQNCRLWHTIIVIDLRLSFIVLSLNHQFVCDYHVTLDPRHSLFFPASEKNRDRPGNKATLVVQCEYNIINEEEVKKCIV